MQGVDQAIHIGLLIVEGKTGPGDRGHAQNIHQGLATQVPGPQRDALLVRHLGHIVGVDDDPAMLELARNAFGWKNAAGVELHLADATTWIHQHSDRFELIVVDLFDDRRFIDGILDPLFLKGLAKLVGSRGHILLNTMVFDEESRDRSARLGQELRLHFNQVNEARYDGNNRVFIALWTGT